MRTEHLPNENKQRNHTLFIVIIITICVSFVVIAQLWFSQGYAILWIKIVN